MAGGAYTLGVKQGAKQETPAAPAGKLQPGAQAPANHPPVAQVAQQEQEPVREGKVQTDPSAKFTHFRVGNRNVKDIFVDGKVVWIGTSGGVIRYDTASDQYKLWDARTGLLSNGIFHVSRLDGKLMVGTYGGGMSLLVDPAKGEWKNYNVPDGLGDAFIYDVLRMKNGDLWIATWSGANRVKGGALDDRSQWELYTVENTRGGLPNDWVYGLAEGKNGEVWFATEGGLARFKDGKWSNWNHAKGLGAPYEKVRKDIEFKSDPGKMSEHHAKQKQEMGLQNVDIAYNPNYIVSMAVDRDGAVWVGTWGGGLSRYDGSKWKTYTTAEGLPGNHVFMLHFDRKGRFWVGTSRGLARKDGEKFQVYTTNEGLISDAVFSMDTAEDGSLWIGSFGGVTHLRP
ncbi:MAG: regulator [Betaproteobacteria bacterium]|nr:regulator [Betaproteobacteria bacterium]